MIYPRDISAASDAWGANCGPCSLAALLDRTVASIKPLLADFDKRPYMNATHMKGALDIAGARYRVIGRKMPRYGLAFIQWGGHEHKHIYAQYRFTHWIAVDARLITKGDSTELATVFEVNAPFLVAFDEWQRQMSRITREAELGNGTYFVRTGLEVDFPNPLSESQT